MRPWIPLLLCVGLLGCPEEEEPTTFPPGEPPVETDDDDDTPDLDEDGDGYPGSVDCDDSNPLAHPGAPELCDEVDNNCNGEVDEEPLADLNWYFDGDGDGYGDNDDVVTGCIGPDGYVLTGGDCNDDSAIVHPGARIDGIDADCDGRIEWRIEITLTVVRKYTLCVDDEDDVVGTNDDWDEAETYTVWLDSGDHTIGFEGEGVEYDKDEEWDLTGALVYIEMTDGTAWWSNSAWRFDPDPLADEETRVGWCSPGFDADSWQPAREFGSFGAWPWGDLPEEMEETSAVWIWDDVPVEHNTQFFRFDLTLP